MKRLTLLFVFLSVTLSFGWGTPVFERYENSFTVPLDYTNPFDTDSVRVDARITSPDGEEIVYPCFYDGENRWNLRFAPTRPGEYAYVIEANTAQEQVRITEGQFTATASGNRGYVRIGDNPRHFAFDNGESYFPLGQNLGWVWGGDPELWKTYLQECADARINWIRIWMCPWGNTELTWTPRNNRYHGIHRYELRNARLWDTIVEEAERHGILIQWVIHHHGQYSINHNPEWQHNPFNAANGGFLDSPEEFFTDEEARRHYRNRLRYLVARWGYSPTVMAWEFWNEVDLTHNYSPKPVFAWHEEMAGVLRGLDPTGRLLTTSVAHGSQALIELDTLDFLQSHAYRTDIIDWQQNTARSFATRAPRKPHFFGEMSYHWEGPNTEDREGVILHNQLWSSIHSWDSGTAMTWWWDNWVRPYDLYFHFRHLAAYVEGIDWNEEPLIPMEAIVEAHPHNAGDFTFTPVVGWGPTTFSEFRIHSNGTVDNLDRCTRFIHGRNHRDMAPNPTFILNEPHPVVFGLRIEKVAAAGAALVIRVNDRQIVRRVFDRTEVDSTIRDNAEIEIPLDAGENRIAIQNRGNDWIQIQHYWVDDLVQRPQAFARGHSSRALVWVHDRAHQFSRLNRYAEQPALHPVPVRLPELTRGDFHVEQFNPYTGDRTPIGTLTAEAGGLTLPLPTFERDTAFRIRRVPSGIDSTPIHKE